MSKLGNAEGLEYLFHPRSIALAGITIANPDHWTRTFLDALLEFEYEGQIYLVNPRGGQIGDRKVYRRLEDISGNIDYVISTVPAEAAPGLIDECAAKGVKAVHFCTAGFSETSDNDRIKLEDELAEVARRKGIRVLGPNCMGIYCPKSRLSFYGFFPKESGPIGFISQSGGNVASLVRPAKVRGVRFSKAISYGNACDLNESDFLEYLINDDSTEIIALYIEGVKDGERFRQVLKRAATEKVVILLKGGTTQSGARATAGHTGAMAGEEVVWESLCKQSGVIRVCSMEELVDLLVTLLFLPPPEGRRAAIIGGGGGASVLISDQFEKSGLIVPPLPLEINKRIRAFTPIAGNFFSNPIDYGQNMLETENVLKTLDIISRWDGTDFIIGHIRMSEMPPRVIPQIYKILDSMLEGAKLSPKPMAMVIEAGILPEEADEILTLTQKCVSAGVAIYYTFASAASAINQVLRHRDNLSEKLGQVRKGGRHAI